tara:strand:- start:1 stop:873 length:873 start_codon:yes stop_codon:yes gene_type:complete
MNYRKQQNVILLTTVYPGIETYFDDFISSVNAQDNTNFQLLIINDNFKNLESHLAKINIDKTHVFSSKQSPEMNRIYGIKKCKELYADIIIFADSDDTFSTNRISETINYFNDPKLDILINDICICDSDINMIKDSYISERIENEAIINKNSIRHYNFCGLSNSAIRSKICKIEEIIPISPFDWTFYTNLLFKGAHARFTSNIKTYYRQHSQNFVGISDSIDDDKIMKALDTKINHYKKLDNIFGGFDNLIEFYESVLLMNEAEQNLYKQKCYQRYKENSFWWEEVMDWS